MSSSSVRAFPPAAALAIVGGIAGLIALFLPWFAIDPEGFLQLAKALGLDTSIAEARGLSPEQLEQQMLTSVQGLNAFAAHELVGYKVFSPVSVAVQGLAAAGAIYAALRMLSGEQPSAMSGPLIGGGLILGGRAVYGILQAPGNGDLPLQNFDGQLVTPAIGLWVALAAGATLLAAAFAASMQGATTRPTEWVGPAGGVPGGAHVPSGVTTQTPADVPPVPGYAASTAPSYGTQPAAYAPPPATAYTPPPSAAYAPPPPVTAFAPPPAAGDRYAGAHVPQPANFEPGMAYGEEGPSSLDAAKNAPRAVDPYAPKRAIAPDAMPPAPVAPPPAPVAPLRPAPLEAPQTPGPPRGSVAPPGMG